MGHQTAADTAPEIALGAVHKMALDIVVSGRLSYLYSIEDWIWVFV